ncbi:hypothetical protein HDU99_007314 [Rhizoclosmatium hyalinum]|nr:hypothetical protein HDU99_007314 [Rhizoclosmatium hyalinum]
MKKTKPTPTAPQRELTLTAANRAASSSSVASGSNLALNQDPHKSQIFNIITANAKAISEAKSNIQSLEKTYRESQQFRRLQNNPLAVFNEYALEASAAPAAGNNSSNGGRQSIAPIGLNLGDLIGVGGGSDEILSKVTKELAGVKALKEKTDLDKIRERNEREEVLRDSVSNTKEYYKAKQECMHEIIEYTQPTPKDHTKPGEGKEDQGSTVLEPNITPPGLESLSSDGISDSVSKSASVERISKVAPTDPDSPRRSQEISPTQDKQQSASNLDEKSPADVESPVDGSEATPSTTSSQPKQPPRKEPPPQYQHAKPSYQKGTIKILEIIHLDLIPPSSDSHRAVTPSVAPGNTAPQRTSVISKMKNKVLKKNSIISIASNTGPVGTVSGVIKAYEAAKRVIPPPSEGPTPVQSLVPSLLKDVNSTDSVHGSKVGFGVAATAVIGVNKFEKKGSTMNVKDSNVKLKDSVANLKNPSSDKASGSSLPVPIIQAPTLPTLPKLPNVRMTSVIQPSEPEATTFSSHGFFIGTSLGEAIILEIEISDLKKVTHSIKKRKRISLQPVKTMCVAEFHEAIVSVVSHTPTDRYVIAHSLELKPIWECKVEFCSGAARDHGTRKVQQGELSVFNLQGLEGVHGTETYLDKSGRPLSSKTNEKFAGNTAENPLELDETVITCLCSDKFNKRILVSLKSGSVVSITAPFVITDINNRKNPPIQPHPPGHPPGHKPHPAGASVVVTPSPPGTADTSGSQGTQPNIAIVQAPSMSDFTRTGSTMNLALNNGKKSKTPSNANLYGSLTGLSQSRIGSGKKSNSQLFSQKKGAGRGPSPLSRQVSLMGGVTGSTNSMAATSNELFTEIQGNRDLIVAYLIDTYNLDSLLKVIWEAEETISSVVVDDSGSITIPQATKSKAEGGYVCVPISSMSIFSNDNLSKDQLLITCPDGTIRIYTLNDGGSIDGVIPNLIQLSDPESRTQLTSVNPSRTHNFEIASAFCKSRAEVQLVLGFSSEGNLSIFDVDDNTVLLDMLILTNRRIERPQVQTNIAAVAMAAARARAGSLIVQSERHGSVFYAAPPRDLANERKTESRAVRIVNPEKGLFLVWAGREWSLMTNRTLIAWKLRHVGGGLDRTSGIHEDLGRMDSLTDSMLGLHRETDILSYVAQ